MFDWQNLFAGPSLLYPGVDFFMFAFSPQLISGLVLIPAIIWWALPTIKRWKPFGPS